LERDGQPQTGYFPVTLRNRVKTADYASESEIVTDSSVDDDRFGTDVGVNQPGRVVKEGEPFAELENPFLDLGFPIVICNPPLFYTTGY
jgi:hypothetical protein